MKLRTKLAIIATLFFSFIGLSLGLVSKNTLKVSADTKPTYPGPGSSGTILLVGNQGGDWFSGFDCAVYFYNSESDNMWSEKGYKMSGGLFRIMLPYKNGQSKQWSYCIICKYKTNNDPLSDGWAGKESQTDNLQLSTLSYRNQNTFFINGDSDGRLSVAEMKNATPYYGIGSNNHMYLDLSQFQGWEDGNAKFALYFALPEQTNESRWSSFCWRVEGQDNPHLYECIVPSYAGGENVWNLVIAVRFSPDLAIPCWPEDASLKWGQTKDLSFNSTNHTGNMIHIDDWWNGGYIDVENSISMDTRVEFYGQYFMDTVSCSGSGNSDATTSAQWDAVKYEYQNHLSTKFQGEVWKAVADKSTSASLVSQAMARYDYIVLYKRYNHEDFINRAKSPNKTTYSGSYIPDSDIQNNNFVIIYIIAGVSILSLATLVILKKKHK